MPYQPNTPPERIEDLRKYIFDELRHISEALQPLQIEVAAFKTEQVGVSKPRAGLVVYSAAGVLGVNEGLYRFDSTGAWVYIG